jgi:hypothetical protein
MWWEHLNLTELWTKAIETLLGGITTVAAICLGAYFTRRAADKAAETQITRDREARLERALVAQREAIAEFARLIARYQADDTKVEILASAIKKVELGREREAESMLDSKAITSKVEFAFGSHEFGVQAGVAIRFVATHRMGAGRMAAMMYVRQIQDEMRRCMAALEESLSLQFLPRLPEPQPPPAGFEEIIGPMAAREAVLEVGFSRLDADKIARSVHKSASERKGSGDDT